MTLFLICCPVLHNIYQVNMEPFFPPSSIKKANEFISDYIELLLWGNMKRSEKRHNWPTFYNNKKRFRETRKLHKCVNVFLFIDINHCETPDIHLVIHHTGLSTPRLEATHLNNLSMVLLWIEMNENQLNSFRTATVMHVKLKQVRCF